MKISQELFLALSLMVLFYPESSVARPQDGGGVPNWCDPTHPMGAWLNFKAIKELCGLGGGDGAAADESQAPPPPGGASDAAMGGGDGIPPWCDPTNPMGAWMNFEKIREMCKEMGFDVGPYGGK